MIGNILIALIGILHVYILILEMFLWDKPQGLKAFGNTLEKAKLTKVLAQNQGLYNGFLAAGLFSIIAGRQPRFFPRDCHLLFRLCVGRRDLWWTHCQ